MNIYKMGGVILSQPESSCDEIKPSTHTCGRLFARAVQRVAFVVSISFLLLACEKATLLPSDEDSDSRSKEGVPDSTVIEPTFDVNGWDGAINVDFTFGGEEEEE